ncbi:hypothetical protein MG293_017747 [Ovis ammon polii]|uniref:Uncharacterized protein n=1 Tax=Ovis ammon polii TaxID=230172 RepID=A0AAD4Y338_OVIAM|nr:hypothetical protein MG293_017747 [Ovis ammon polii]
MNESGKENSFHGDPGPKYDFLSPELSARLAPQNPGLGPTGGTRPDLHRQAPKADGEKGAQVFRFPEEPIHHSEQPPNLSGFTLPNSRKDGDARRQRCPLCQAKKYDPGRGNYKGKRRGVNTERGPGV